MFEEIDKYTDRLPVPGGWIVRTCYYNFGVHMLFIEDPSHTWQLEKKDDTQTSN